MKKTAALFLMVLCLTLTACGGTESTGSADTASESTAAEAQDSTAAEAQESTPEAAEEAAASYDTDTTPITEEMIEEAGIDSFVSVEDYKGKEYTKTITTITEADIDERVATDLSVYTVAAEEGTKIEAGMSVNIDYVGSVDGVEFEGGNSNGQGHDLVIGSHSFVDDFEEQLIGAEKGDEVTVTVNFPEDYYENLAGKEADFAVTINEINLILTEPTDEWASANFGYATVEEYREGLRKELQAAQDYISESTLRSSVWSEIVEGASFFRYPQELMDKYTSMVRAAMEEVAVSYGLTLDAFMTENGIDDSYISASAKEYVRMELVADYIIYHEYGSLDDSHLEEKKQYLLEQNGLASEEEMVAAGVTVEQLDFAARNNLAVDAVFANGTVKEAEAEPEEETSESAEVTESAESAEGTETEESAEDSEGTESSESENS